MTVFDFHNNPFHAVLAVRQVASWINHTSLVSRGSILDDTQASMNRVHGSSGKYPRDDCEEGFALVVQ